MRPIDADAFEKKLIKELNSSGKYTHCECGLDDAILWLEEQPTIEQPTWISCAERLPEDDERVREHKDFRLSLRSVLVYDKERGVLIANRYKVVACGTVCLDELVTDGWVWSNNAQNVTHWMSLPEPPKGDE